MPFQIPAFSSFQWQVPAPLKGNWNRAPVEGDRILNAEIDWLAGGATATAYQFQCGGNSPIALSQIVAMYCDNRRCGSDVTLWFPDTGFELVIPAHTQGLFPVFTNALTFYAIGNNAAAGDVTILQVCNSMPPPIALLPATQQQTVSITGVALNANATTPAIPAGTSGTVTGLSLIGLAVASGAAVGAVNIALQDGTGKTVWYGTVTAPASGSATVNISLSGLSVRFVNGLSIVTTGTSGMAVTSALPVTVYYTTP